MRKPFITLEAKSSRVLVVAVAAFLILDVLYFLFVFDIGVNSKFFVKRDFSNAFLARTTGNCNHFKDYVNPDYQDQWGERCIAEKDRALPSIKNFSIKSIMVNGGSAFLKVELERDPTIETELKVEDQWRLESISKYEVNYDMRRSNSGRFLYILPRTRWIIMNEIS